MIENDKPDGSGETRIEGPQRDAKGRLVAGSGSLNPHGRPKGSSWSTMLQELAETRKRGGGGKTRQQVILNNLLERAESDNQATSLLLDRVEGKPVAKVINAHFDGQDALNASISFVEPIKEVDITPPAAENPASS